MHVKIELTKNEEVCSITVDDMTVNLTPSSFAMFERCVAKLHLKDHGCEIMSLQMSEQEIPFEDLEEDDD